MTEVFSAVQTGDVSIVQQNRAWAAPTLLGPIRYEDGKLKYDLVITNHDDDGTDPTPQTENFLRSFGSYADDNGVFVVDVMGGQQLLDGGFSEGPPIPFTAAQAASGEPIHVETPKAARPGGGVFRMGFTASEVVP